MAKRTDINSILLIGSGPIVIGQACEFDYSGTQAIKALKEEGYKVILVNSNPATIMTDPSLADATYIEPLTIEFLEKIIEIERPDALLPTLGGQTGLNLAMELFKAGILEKFGVEMIGAKPEVIKKAEGRSEFKEAMKKIGLNVPTSEVAYTIEDAKKVAEKIGFPCIIRSAFTLGGAGGGIAWSPEELETIATGGLEKSMISEIMIEQSILGWKEYELEVMRDKNDNVVIVCSIENFDPMGTHTGDSITVAPAQTLSDKEYQIMRNAALDIIREIGVETGGSNVQFAINPENGDMIVIEMNPRVSRSSALASKATGFPIAKLAAKLAIGYTLDELKNDITVHTPASFEPALDYIVVKIPRFNFDKFPGTTSNLGVSMKSVGEVMAIGRTFKDAMQKAIRGLEIKRFGLTSTRLNPNFSQEKANQSLINPNPERLFMVIEAIKQGMSLEEIYNKSKIDPWFLVQLKQIQDFTAKITDDKDSLRKAKQYGFSDHQLADLLGKKSEFEIRARRKELDILPSYKIVDTCAGEFEAHTPYFYSSYDQEDESRVSDNQKVMILGGGPNRIGQGIEFDYCCCHAAFTLKELGYESIMVNSNPETVSTDYDTSDKLYFEPLTIEDVLNIYENESPIGVIVQYGGQTPLNLAKTLTEQGVKLLGTSYDSIDRAEDRERFGALIEFLNLKQPPNGLATTAKEAIAIAQKITYPVLIRPSYVLGGSAMEIVYTDNELKTYMTRATEVSPEHPILIDKYLEDALEVDVDALADGQECVVAGIMEHIEEAGVHSGDSASVLPPHSIVPEMVQKIRESTHKLAIELNVIGLLNIQFAIKDNELYVLEVNPRASRTVPFVSKATGVPWAKMATKIMLGKTIKELSLKEIIPTHTSVKEAVFPFNRFPENDTQLGPEMKSTGEVMGIDKEFGMAYIKSQIAAGQIIPSSGQVFISVKNTDKDKLLPIAKTLTELGFTLLATKGTHECLKAANIDCTQTLKVYEGSPNVVDEMKAGNIKLIINTPSGKNPIRDEVKIRTEATALSIPVITTIAGAEATTTALKKLNRHPLTPTPLQNYNPITL